MVTSFFVTRLEEDLLAKKQKKCCVWARNAWRKTASLQIIFPRPTVGRCRKGLTEVRFYGKVLGAVLGTVHGTFHPEENVVHRHAWAVLDVGGHRLNIWTLPDTSGRSWTCMGSAGRWRTCMDIYGHKWSLVDKYGLVWTITDKMDVRGHQWTFVDRLFRGPKKSLIVYVYHTPTGVPWAYFRWWRACVPPEYANHGGRCCTTAFWGKRFPVC